MAAVLISHPSTIMICAQAESDELELLINRHTTVKALRVTWEIKYLDLCRENKITK